MTDTALILGGYGGAGRACAEVLLRETRLQLVVGGRDADRAAAAAAELNDQVETERVIGRGVDATDRRSLARALEGCGMIIVCAPLEGCAVDVVQAAIDAGVDWLDICIGARRQQALRAAADDIERNGLCFVTEAGAMPGLPSALVRFAADRLDHASSAAVATLMKVGEIGIGSAEDMMRQLADVPAVYDQSGWHRAGFTATRRFDFEAPFGPKSCFPVDLIEMRELPGQLGLAQLGTYAGGVNPILDLLVVAAAIGRIGSFERGVSIGANLMVRAGRRFTKPPFGVQIRLEAEGLVDGSPMRLDLLIAHEDGYVMTAVPMVACIQQMLDGSIRRPGVHYMGCAVDPVRLLNDLQRLGLRVVGL